MSSTAQFSIQTKNSIDITNIILVRSNNKQPSQNKTKKVDGLCLGNKTLLIKDNKESAKLNYIQVTSFTCHTY